MSWIASLRSASSSRSPSSLSFSSYRDIKIVVRHVLLLKKTVETGFTAGELHIFLRIVTVVNRLTQLGTMADQVHFTD
jgi:hypothetical protein